MVCYPEGLTYVEAVSGESTEKILVPRKRKQRENGEVYIMTSLSNMYSLPNIISVMKSRAVILAFLERLRNP